MRVNSINNYHSSYVGQRTNLKTKNVSFEGKHDCAKFLAATFGTLGTLGAIGGTIIMTGGLVLPAIAIYGAACAGSGALIGHQIDKAEIKDDKKNNK